MHFPSLLWSALVFSAVGLVSACVSPAPPPAMMYYVPPGTADSAGLSDSGHADSAAAGDSSAGLDAAADTSVDTTFVDTAAGDLAPADSAVTPEVSPASSCVGRCDSLFSSKFPCQCGWDCAKYGSCCSDWIAACRPQDQLDWYPAPAGVCSKPSDWIKIKSNPDGDTLHLPEYDASGKLVAVRLLLVDTPETTVDDCFAQEAKKFTYDTLIKSSMQVCLVAEPTGDDKDIYGRLLRYVYVKVPGQPLPVQLNLRLLRLGLGRILYPFASGNPLEKWALETMALAKSDQQGGWANCGWIKPK